MDVELLMEIQYNLPISNTPLVDLAENLGRDVDEVIKKLKLYSKLGILKRYGLNLNYKAFPNYKQAALVGLKSYDREVIEKINKFDEFKVKHNYLRDSEYKVWFTVKGKDLEEIKNLVKNICKKNYIILPTKRIYKMNVKFDLYKGISWSSKKLEPKDVPTISELGLDEKFVKSLESLEITKRPFLNMGYSEEEVVSTIEELIRIGIGRDFSGVLKESKIGFKENCMTVLRVSDAESIAIKLVENFPQITHLIERETCNEWKYQLYFVVHARNRKPIEEIVNRVMYFEGVEDVKPIYSKANLRDFSL